jgi:hypothetical protein
MIQFLVNKASDRKFRLFACACCRVIAGEDAAVKGSIALAELYADGHADESEVGSALQKRTPNDPFAGCLLGPDIARGTRYVTVRLLGDEFRPATAQFVRDIFGNPLRPAAFNSAWLTSDVRILAAGVYQDSAFDRLPILADALQDAGCEDEDILAHCRGPGPHVRGCWVVDLVLGKE